MQKSDGSFKDCFSNVASGYGRYRPGYPDEMFAYLASISPSTKRVWDCATGSGQAAVALVKVFDEVVATDASSKQIDKAVSHEGIEYRVAPAEASGLESASVDLVTVAQAVHWFDQPAFMQESGRVLVPDGVLAIWTYNLFRVTDEIDAVVDDFYWRILEGYWDTERRQVENGYSDLQIPFSEIKPPPFQMEAKWNLEHVLGYLRTWSAVRSYREKTGVDPVDLISRDLSLAWESNDVVRRISWPLTLRIGINRD